MLRRIYKENISKTLVLLEDICKYLYRPMLTFRVYSINWCNYERIYMNDVLAARLGRRGG